MTDKNVGKLVKDDKGNWYWRTKERELIPVIEMTDSHLRNAALYLMGMGYQECIMGKNRRVMWLSVLRREWDRRLLERAYEGKSWKVKDRIEVEG